jgi:hypothetical protein
LSEYLVLAQGLVGGAFGRNGIAITQIEMLIAGRADCEQSIHFYRFVLLETQVLYQPQAELP